MTTTAEKRAMLPGDYWSGDYTATLSDPNYDSPFKVDAFLRLFRRVAAAHQIQVGSYADVGCGGGGDLQGISRALLSEGHLLTTPVGYDVSAYVADLEVPGLRFVHGDFLRVGEPVDMVTLFDVIEHVPAPIDFLKGVAEKCDVIGLHIPLDKTLANELGDRFRLKLRYPGHLSYWSAAEALTLLTSAGLVVLDYDWTMGFTAPSGRVTRLQRIAFPARRALALTSPWLLSRTIGGASLMVLAATATGQVRLQRET